jgi:hypothetical protein
MAWRICYAVVCPCGAVRVDLGARDPDQLIEEAHRSGWEEGLCPECARWRGRQEREVFEGPAG